MVSNWKKMKIGDFITLEYGKPLDKSKRKDDGIYPAYGANGIKCRSDEFYFDKKTIIVGRKGSAGEITITEERFWPLDVTYFVTFDDDKYDLTFIYYLLSRLNLPSLATGVKPGINRNNVYAIDVFIPDIQEQKRIVALLDSVFADLEQTRAKTEQNLKNATELFDSYLNAVFENNVSGTEHDALNDICELIVDCEHKTAPKQETGYPSIRTPNIGKGFLILEGVNRVSEETYITWTRRAIPKENDLILAREAPAGNIGVIPKNVKVCLGQRTVLIRPKKDKFISKYLAFLILSSKVQKQLLSHSTGATVQHINMKDIRAFKIYNLPSLVEQEKVVNGIDKILNETKKLETIYSQKIDNLDELKKSILQKAFSGELTTMAK